MRKAGRLTLCSALVLVGGCRVDYDLLPASEGVVDTGGMDAATATSTIWGEAGSNDGGVSGTASGDTSTTSGPGNDATSGHGGSTNTGSDSTTSGDSSGGSGGAPSSDDATCDGIDDDDDGEVDEDYVAAASACGAGVCQATGTRQCVSGNEIDDCAPGPPLSVGDATCDNTDDDCDGEIDEGYVTTASACGVGACQSTGTLQCVSGSQIDDCAPGSPDTTEDGPVANGLDDDCDGVTDEDVVPCDTTPRSFLPGEHLAIEVPLNCSQVSVRLWGGAGAGGELEGVLFQPGGRGGAGGYAESLLAVSGTLDLYVGGGGAAGCNLPGATTGPLASGGGTGNWGAGADGEDGLVVGGGSGADPPSARPGGDGFYGGGGGGEGDAVIGSSGRAGGGGAASYLLMGGSLTMVAGGGGGGGGAASILLLLGVPGGDGGQGCSGDGKVADVSGGGGGGGGVCIGTTMQQGNNGTPFDAASLPSGQAAGGTSSCNAGGGGYAIVTFSA